MPSVSRIVGFVAQGALVVAAVGGPLSPPAGPVTSSYKTLTEVEPRKLISTANTPGDANSVFRISNPGSYYLGDNLTGASGRHTIEVEADNVTIDLNGFSIVGVAGSLDGINVPASRRNLVVRDGTIRSHGGSGIFASNAPNSILSNLILADNTLDGLSAGRNAQVSHVSCLDNARHGFALDSANGSIMTNCISAGNTIGYKNIGSDCIVRDCLARSNRSDGFEVNAATRVVNCSSIANTGWGFRFVGDRSTLDGCNAEFNVGGGFRIGGFDSVLSRCVARSNGRGTPASSGFLFTSGPTNLQLNDCIATFNGAAGFDIQGGRASLTNCTSLENSTKGLDSPGQAVRVISCELSGNTTLGADVGQGSVIEASSIRNNGGDGLKVNGNGNAVIRRSQIVSNGGNGMSVVNGSVVEDCLISGNVLNGINATSLSAIRRCTFDGNGSAPGTTNAQIFCNGNANFIEDNTIYSGDPGIQLTVGGGTIVRRNTIIGTANNYGLIVAGNRVAPINSSATLTTTNPNDNYGY
jgi:hypothetical protein